MITTFRKPQRRAGNVRRIVVDDDDEDEEKVKKSVDDQEASNEATSIAQFREKARKSAGKSLTASSKSSSKKSSSLLSFDDEEEGEVFQVKKSSESRRLIKERKKKEKSLKQSKPQLENEIDENSKDSFGKISKEEEEEEEDVIEPQLQKHQKSNVIDSDLDIKFKDTVKSREKPQSWILTGREAEALHFEEEDEEEERQQQAQESKNGGSSRRGNLRNILESGAIPDAAAIHALKKQRQAARERGVPPEVRGETSKDYISLESNKGLSKGRSRLVRDEEDDKDSGDERISFTGVKSEARDRKIRQEEMAHEEHSGDEEVHADWEELQIRKAMRNAQIDPYVVNNSATSFPGAMFEQHSNANDFSTNYSLPQQERQELAKPASYNLEGIKARLKERIRLKTEVHRRHVSDADRAVDELVESQTEIERLESAIPELTERHKFYQELRGYVTDLVECYNEKLSHITYLEDRHYKLKAGIREKIMDRRREDVRDQMIELSSKPQKAQTQQQQEESIAEASRQRRAAEREGRRRRRQIQRQSQKNYSSTVKHNEGLSSDDELSTLDQANISKTRQDIESQARQILSDVVDDFATIRGVKERMESWRNEDFSSYNDAYVSLCLPKVFSPLVRLQLLFWNPFAENNEIDQMEWFRTLATFGFRPTESHESLKSDIDKRLLSLTVEKVIFPKTTALVKAAYDPLSTSQTLRLTALLKKFVSDYPNVRGDSKQVRELVNVVVERLKHCIENDPYIPIGYSKQVLENPNGSHANFVNRQFWTTFKLLKNILAWHGFIGDSVLADMALNSIISRYLLIGLGMNPDSMDAINKARHVVNALPSEWREKGLFKGEMQRFAGYLSNLGKTGKGIGREGIIEVANMLKYIGFPEESDAIRRTRL